MIESESIKIEGQTYKIGLCGNVFVYRNDEWIRSSNYTPDEIQRYINKPPRTIRNYDYHCGN